MGVRLSQTLPCGAVSRVLLLALGMGSIGPLALAQGIPSAQAHPPAAPAQLAPGPGPGEVAIRSNTLIAASVGGALAYGYAKWWQDGLSGEFKTVREGWFGRNTDYGGADKLGHGMFAYAGSRLLAHALREAGNDPATALRLGLATAVGTLMGVEVIDGFSARWRFSREDAVANVAGGALAYLMETHPRLDALLDLRLQYLPSNGPGRGKRFDPFSDYSGQRYLAVFKASGVPAWREHPVLRYLEFNIGYGARNFEPESRALARPTRHVYVGIALNLSEALGQTVFRGQPAATPARQLTDTALEFLQVPAATWQHDHVLR